MQRSMSPTSLLKALLFFCLSLSLLSSVARADCNSYNPCVPGMICCNTPQWHIDKVTRIREEIGLTEIVTIIDGDNYTTYSDVGLPPNSTTHCCYDTDLCSDLIFCEAQIEGGDLGEGNAVVAAIVIAAFILVGLFVLFCFRADGNEESARKAKAARQREVMEKYRTRIDPTAPRRVYSFWDLR